MSHDLERRTSKRIKHAYPLSDAAAGPTRIRDISPTGAAFDSAEAPPPGTMVRLQVELALIPIEIEAQVVRCAGNKGFAVKFADLTPGQIALLTDFLGEAVVARIQSEAVSVSR